MGPKSCDWCPYKRKERKIWGREEAYVKMEAEIGVMSPQTKELQEPSEAEICKDTSALETAKGVRFWQHLGFGLLHPELRK